MGRPGVLVGALCLAAARVERDPALLEVGNSAGCQIESPSFPDMGTIPKKFLCEDYGGRGESPDLKWSIACPGYRPDNDTLAFIVEDVGNEEHFQHMGTVLDTHWVVYNVPSTSTGKTFETRKNYGGNGNIKPALIGNVVSNLPSGAKLPDSVGIQGKNSFGHVGYSGICPEPGTGLHNYHFNMYVLTGTPSLPRDATALQLRFVSTALTRCHCLFTGVFDAGEPPPEPSPSPKAVEQQQSGDQEVGTPGASPAPGAGGAAKEYEVVTQKTECKALTNFAEDWGKFEDIKCDEDQPMTSWEFKTCPGETTKTRMEFGCAKTKKAFDCGPVKKTGCTDVKDADLTEFAKHGMQCGAGETLSSFRLRSDGCAGDKERQFHYRCCKDKKKEITLGTCEDVNMRDCADAKGEKAAKLSGFYAKCEDPDKGNVLTGFKFEKCAGPNKYKVVAKCCKLKED